MDKLTDFEFYLKFTKPLILNLPEVNDRVLAAAWVKKLASESLGTEKIRLDYLKLLLFVLQRKKLIPPFTQHPNASQTLEQFPENQTLIDVAKELLEKEAKERKEKCAKQLKGEGDFPPYVSDFSADLLEYVAVQTIDDFGVHAYYAVSKMPLSSWYRVDKTTLPKAAKSMLEVCTPPPTLLDSHSTPEISEAPSSPLKPPSPEQSEPSPVTSEPSPEQPPSEEAPTTEPESETEPKSEPESAPTSEPEKEETPKKKKESPRKSTLGASPPSRPIGKISPPPEEWEPPTWGSNLLEAKFLEEDLEELEEEITKKFEGLESLDFHPGFGSTAISPSQAEVLWPLADQELPSFLGDEEMPSFLDDDDMSSFPSGSEMPSFLGTPPQSPWGSPASLPYRTPPYPYVTPPPPGKPTPPPSPGKPTPPPPVSAKAKRIVKKTPQIRQTRSSQLLQQKKELEKTPVPPPPKKKAKSVGKKKPVEKAVKVKPPSPPPVVPEHVSPYEMAEDEMAEDEMAEDEMADFMEDVEMPDFIADAEMPDFLEDAEMPDFLEDAEMPDFLKEDEMPDFAEDAGMSDILEDDDQLDFLSGRQMPWGSPASLPYRTPPYPYVTPPPPGKPTPPPPTKKVRKIAPPKIKQTRSSQLLQKKKEAERAPPPPEPKKPKAPVRKTSSKLAQKTAKAKEEETKTEPPPKEEKTLKKSLIKKPSKGKVPKKKPSKPPAPEFASPGEPFMGFPGVEDDVQSYLLDFHKTMTEMEQQYRKDLEKYRARYQREEEVEEGKEEERRDVDVKKQALKLSEIARMSKQTVPKSHAVPLELEKNINISPEARKFLETVVKASPLMKAGSTPFKKGFIKRSPLKPRLQELLAKQEAEELATEAEPPEETVAQERTIAEDEYATMESVHEHVGKDPRIVGTFNEMVDNLVEQEEAQMEEGFQQEIVPPSEAVEEPVRYQVPTLFELADRVAYGDKRDRLKEVDENLQRQMQPTITNWEEYERAMAEMNLMFERAMAEMNLMSQPEGIPQPAETVPTEAEALDLPPQLQPEARLEVVAVEAAPVAEEKVPTPPHPLEKYRLSLHNKPLISEYGIAEYGPDYEIHPEGRFGIFPFQLVEETYELESDEEEEVPQFKPAQIVKKEKLDSEEEEGKPQHLEAVPLPDYMEKHLEMKKREKEEEEKQEKKKPRGKIPPPKVKGKKPAGKPGAKPKKDAPAETAESKSEEDEKKGGKAPAKKRSASKLKRPAKKGGAGAGAAPEGEAAVEETKSEEAVKKGKGPAGKKSATKLKRGPTKLVAEKASEEEIKKELKAAEEKGKGPPGKRPKGGIPKRPVKGQKKKEEPSKAPPPKAAPPTEVDEFEAMERMIEEEMRKKGEDPKARGKKLSKKELQEQIKSLIAVKGKAYDQLESLERASERGYKEPPTMGGTSPLTRIAEEDYEEDEDWVTADPKMFGTADEILGRHPGAGKESVPLPDVEFPEDEEGLDVDVLPEEFLEVDQVEDETAEEAVSPTTAKQLEEDIADLYREHYESAPAFANVPVTTPRPTGSPQRLPKAKDGPFEGLYEIPEFDPGDIDKMIKPYRPTPPRPAWKPPSPERTEVELKPLPTLDEVVSQYPEEIFQFQYQTPPKVVPPELKPVAQIKEEGISPRRRRVVEELDDMHDWLYGTPPKQEHPTLFDLPAEKMYAESPPLKLASPTSPEVSPVDLTHLKKQIDEGRVWIRGSRWKRHIGARNLERYSRSQFDTTWAEPIKEQYETPAWMTWEDQDFYKLLRKRKPIKQRRPIYSGARLLQRRSGPPKLTSVKEVWESPEKFAPDIFDFIPIEENMLKETPPLEWEGPPPLEVEDVEFKKALMKAKDMPEKHFATKKAPALPAIGSPVYYIESPTTVSPAQLSPGGRRGPRRRSLRKKLTKKRLIFDEEPLSPNEEQVEHTEVVTEIDEAEPYMMEGYFPQEYIGEERYQEKTPEINWDFRQLETPKWKKEAKEISPEMIVEALTMTPPRRGDAPQEIASPKTPQEIWKEELPVTEELPEFTPPSPMSEWGAVEGVVDELKKHKMLRARKKKLKLKKYPRLTKLGEYYQKYPGKLPEQVKEDHLEERAAQIHDELEREIEEEMEAQEAAEWAKMYTILDEPVPEGQMSPIKPPIQVPFYSTPPSLRVPITPPRKPIQIEPRRILDLPFEPIPEPETVATILEVSPPLDDSVFLEDVPPFEGSPGVLSPSRIEAISSTDAEEDEFETIEQLFSEEQPSVLQVDPAPATPVPGTPLVVDDLERLKQIAAAQYAELAEDRFPSPPPKTSPPPVEAEQPKAPPKDAKEGPPPAEGAPKKPGKRAIKAIKSLKPPKGWKAPEKRVKKQPEPPPKPEERKPKSAAPRKKGAVKRVPSRGKQKEAPPPPREPSPPLIQLPPSPKLKPMLSVDPLLYEFLTMQKTPPKEMIIDPELAYESVVPSPELEAGLTYEQKLLAAQQAAAAFGMEIPTSLPGLEPEVRAPEVVEFQYEETVKEKPKEKKKKKKPVSRVADAWKKSAPTDAQKVPKKEAPKEDAKATPAFRPGGKAPHLFPGQKFKKGKSDTSVKIKKREIKSKIDTGKGKPKKKPEQEFDVDLEALQELAINAADLYEMNLLDVTAEDIELQPPGSPERPYDPAWPRGRYPRPSSSATRLPALTETEEEYAPTSPMKFNMRWDLSPKRRVDMRIPDIKVAPELPTTRLQLEKVKLELPEETEVYVQPMPVARGRELLLGARALETEDLPDLIEEAYMEEDEEQMAAAAEAAWEKLTGIEESYELAEEGRPAGVFVAETMGPSPLKRKVPLEPSPPSPSKLRGELYAHKLYDPEGKKITKRIFIGGKYVPLRRARIPPLDVLYEGSPPKRTGPIITEIEEESGTPTGRPSSPRTPTPSPYRKAYTPSPRRSPPPSPFRTTYTPPQPSPRRLLPPSPFRTTYTPPPLSPRRLPPPSPIPSPFRTTYTPPPPSPRRPLSPIPTPSPFRRSHTPPLPSPTRSPLGSPIPSPSPYRKTYTPPYSEAQRKYMDLLSKAEEQYASLFDSPKTAKPYEIDFEAVPDEDLELYGEPTPPQFYYSPPPPETPPDLDIQGLEETDDIGGEVAPEYHTPSDVEYSPPSYYSPVEPYEDVFERDEFASDVSPMLFQSPEEVVTDPRLKEMHPSPQRAQRIELPETQATYEEGYELPEAVVEPLVHHQRKPWRRLPRRRLSFGEEGPASPPDVIPLPPPPSRSPQLVKLPTASILAATPPKAESPKIQLLTVDAEVPERPKTPRISPVQSPRISRSPEVISPGLYEEEAPELFQEVSPTAEMQRSPVKIPKYAPLSPISKLVYKTAKRASPIPVSPLLTEEAADILEAVSPVSPLAPAEILALEQSVSPGFQWGGSSPERPEDLDFKWLEPKIMDDFPAAWK